MSTALRDRSEREVENSYAVFLRSTRPAAVIGLSTIVTIVVALISARMTVLGSGSKLDDTEVFYGSVAILSTIFGWRTRSLWSPIIFGTVRLQSAALYVFTAVCATSLAAFLQAMFISSNGTASVPITVEPPFLLLAILAPLSESLVFQGWLQTATSRTLGAPLGLAFTIACFYAIHLHFSAPLLTAVVTLCLIRMYTRSLGTVVISHVSINTFMFCMSALR